MNKLFAPFLPPWVETGLQPAFYDMESGTVLQQTARMYAKVQQLTRLFNELSAETRATVEEYIAKFVELKDFVDNYFDNLDVQEEINNKLDEMAESGELGEIVGEYLQAKVDYYYIDASKTSDEIKAIFATDRAKVIDFENAEFTISGKLVLTSNTEVNLNGASLKMANASVQILGYATDSEWTGYNGIHNVTFRNGEIEIPIALMHNVGIRFKGINFLPSVTHAIQMGGCKDIEIVDCTFNGKNTNDSNLSSSELIQLESCTRNGQPFLDDEDSPSYDHAGNYDVKIINCIFNAGDGTNTKLYTAIGHHSADSDNAYCNKNILIEGCTFGNCYYSHINPVGFDGAIIRNNVFNQTVENETIYTIRFRYSNKNVVIDNNTFIGGWTNIGQVNIGSYIDNVKITNNTFDTTFTSGQSNIIVINLSNSIIKGNNFGRARNHNIQIVGNASYTPTNIDICDNIFTYSKVSGSSRSCIDIQKVSTINVYNNTFFMDNNICYGISLIVADSSDYSIYGNHNIEDGTTTKFLNATGTPDLTTSTGIYQTIYSGTSSYTAVTDATPTAPLSSFNRLLCTVHPNGDASHIMGIVLNAWAPTAKMNDARKFYLDYNGLIGELTIKADGTITYVSSVDYLVLRTIRGYNESIAL